MSSPRKILGQLAERLVAKLDGPESDGGVAPVFARMELTKCQNGLAVSLFVECDCHVEPLWIIVQVRTVIIDQPFSGNDFQKSNAIGENLASWGDHAEAPCGTDARRALFDHFAPKSGWAEPLEHPLRLDPGPVDQVSWRIDDTGQNDFTIEFSAGVGVFDAHEAVSCQADIKAITLV
jgi:hypothetical protein